MRPTLRGVGVLSVAVAATLVGTQFGQRGLAAIAAPLFVALVGAAIQVRLTGTPTIERSAAARDFVGGGDTVSLSVGGSGVARLTDARPEGIDGPATVRTGLPATVRFDLTYEKRGEHRLGPVEVTLTDALGLVVTTVTVDATDEVLVYPPVYRLGDPEDVLQALVPDSDDEQTFDRLREYVPGDSLRDIHWKSSAKRDDLLVKEFDERADNPVLVVAAGARDGHADTMATAAATVAVAALEAGYGVELVTPGPTVERGFGDAQRTRVLAALARAPSGEHGRDDADIVVSATVHGVTVTVDERVRAFEELTTSHENPLEGRA